jgi:hemoglobin
MAAAQITESAISELVRRFYGKARLDPVIGPVFEAAVEDWDHHFDQLDAFWSSVVLATGRYQGRPMRAHMRLPLEPPMFERWLELWSETAGEVFEPEAAEVFRAKARNIARSLSLGLFFRPDAA